jgi:glucose/arabinose dehydrogenase
MKTRLPLFVVCFTAFAVRIACATPVDLFASITGTNQNGGGSIFQYTPAGMQSTFASGLYTPRGLAFDNAGNLFVDTNTSDVSGNSQGTILKFSSGGTESTFATGFGTNIFLEGMAIDKARDVFVTALNGSSSTIASTIVKVTPGGAESTFASSKSLLFGLAFNHAGNLFAVSDSATRAQILEFTPGGTRSIFASSSTIAFTGLVFDKAGNLFVSAGGVTLEAAQSSNLLREVSRAPSLQA